MRNYRRFTTRCKPFINFKSTKPRQILTKSAMLKWNGRENYGQDLVS